MVGYMIRQWNRKMENKKVVVWFAGQIKEGRKERIKRNRGIMMNGDFCGVTE